MLTFVFSLILLAAAAEWQNQMSNGDGGTQDQECVLLITSPIIVSDDPTSKSFISTDDLEIVRPNETMSLITGKFNLMQEMDDLTRLEIVVRKNHMTVLTLEMELCKEINLGEESDYYSLLKFFAFSGCPIDPGQYTLTDWVVNLDDLPINSGNIGDYEANMNLKKCKDTNCNQNTFLCSLRLTCVIEPVDGFM